MPDSPDQIIHKLQQENNNLKNILKQKDKKLEQKDEELNLERQLWSSREADWDPDASVDLHRIEVFDGVISDESSLHSDPAQQGRVPVHFGTRRGMRHCLRWHAAVSRRRIRGV